MSLNRYFQIVRDIIIFLFIMPRRPSVAGTIGTVLKHGLAFANTV